MSTLNSKLSLIFFILTVLLTNIRTFPQEESLLLTGPYFNQAPPGSEPVLFVPEELRSNDSWFWHGAPAFSPDGNEFYLDIIENGMLIKIQYTERINDVWTELQPPAFAGSGNDASTSFINDGYKVFFISDRPNGNNYAVWTSTRNRTSWTAPTPVIIPARPGLGGGWRVSVAENETIYMQMVDNNSNTDYDIYKSELIDGSYTIPQRLSENVNSSSIDINMFVDPEERYIIFSSMRPGGYGYSDLYICGKESDGSWAPAVNMGPQVNSSSNDNSPFVSADGLYLFFNSNRDPQYGRNPYWVSAEVIDELITDVDEDNSSGQYPNEFKLLQNYPNPFNPVTIIEYRIPDGKIQLISVTLKIYNAIGKHIATLVDEQKCPGNYTVEMDAVSLPSGIYFYKLTAGDFRATKKMVLLK
jgi:hypothetical protein